MIIALTIAVLMAGGVYLALQRGMVRIVIGMGLISHATNLIILAAGIGAWRGEPFAGRTSIDDAADPLPQAFVLTAIVITMATTAFMLALAALGRSDDTRSAEDPEHESSLDSRARKASPISPHTRRGRRVHAVHEAERQRHEKQKQHKQQKAKHEDGQKQQEGAGSGAQGDEH
ncbi:cation:proton antiporter subunit C [Corynebacterium argentoratense]|uniref:cation:proton antiporter subunit C n=1 Tax=Corynebacterium argentoratense TaxID=42817 RepID=UPI001F15BEB1|nr:cation:proton antiporter subunit C [Corynebacterium argentoratense]MCF1694015.1 cation:proton antiporter subunit C [Corynebacterium argentoratense]MCF1735586.1 cation:proton antiporter subunit C [Corynebacterium argentoratense]